MTVEVIHGDALVEVPRLGARTSEPPINCVLADPPFNLGKDYGAGIEDDLPAEDYASWLRELYRACFHVAAENAVLYAFCQPEAIPGHREAIEGAGWTFWRQLFWYGPNGPAWWRGSKQGANIWAALTEAITYAGKGEGCARGDSMPEYHSTLIVPRPQSNFRAGRWHVCEKPVRLYKLLLQAHSGITRVLDPTCGSGSALVACVELGLDAVGVELSRDTAELAAGRVRCAEAGLPYVEHVQGQQPLFTAGGAEEEE